MVAAVLVVDDDASVASLVTAILKRDGLRVSTASDGPAALLAMAAERFDAVLTDMTMPGMSGLQLLRSAEAAGHRVPFLVMSAYLDPETERHLCEDAGVAGVLRKPFDIDRLVGDVRAVLRAEVDDQATTEPMLALLPRRLVEQVAARLAWPPATAGSAAGRGPC